MSQETKLPVLHELLAVEQSSAESANHVTKDTIKNLNERRALYDGMTKSHSIFDEALQHLAQATEVKEVQSTATEQLDYLSKVVGDYYDIILQKETANQHANADIIINGVTIATGIPAIVLLGLEKKLEALKAVYNAIPTLDAARTWTKAEGYSRPNVFVTVHPEERFHSVVTKNWEVIVPATEHHPAQTKEIEKSQVIGKYIINTFSGALTSEDKANKIARLVQLITAVKKARQRANNVEVQAQRGFGEALFSFING